MPAFLTLLDVQVDDPHWQALDPPSRRQRTLNALKHLLLKESQIQPLGLALEDLHWIDSETQGLLDSLIDLPFSLLEAIADLADEALQRGLAHLQAAEFLYQTRLFPDVEYTFKHGLTYEVAYNSLLHERRRFLHARIVEVIETLSPDRLGEQVERLAYHAVRSEIWEKAVPYLSQAGARALDRSAYREAAPYFEQALAALAHLPQTRDTQERAIDLRLGLRNSLFPIGEIDAVLGHLRAAEQLAVGLDDKLRLARVSVATSHHFLVAGNAEEARKYGERAFEFAQTLGDLQLQVAANLYLGAALVALAELRQAEACLRRTVGLLGGDLARERFGLHGLPAAIAHSYLAWALAELGDFGGAVAHGREAVEIADATRHAYTQAYACWGLAIPHMIRGDLTEASRVLERGASLVREWNLPLIGALIAGLLGRVRARLGNVQDAVSLAREGVATYETSFGSGIWHTMNLVSLSESLLLANEPDEARASAERALALAREFKHRICEPWALLLLAEIAGARAPPDGRLAEECYREALLIAEERGMRPLMANCRLGLASLCQRSEKVQEANDHLATATAIIREMNVPRWQSPADHPLTAAR